LVVYFLPRLFDFFSCPEFPFFLVICFLEFLLFVVVYFLPRLSDFDFYVHKEADERPSPFFLLFFLLDFSFESKLMSGRLFAAPKQHQVQPVTC